jgi:integrase
MARIDGKLTSKAPKSTRSVRAVPLFPSAVSMLRKHRTEQNERRLRLGAAWSDNDLIVDNGDGAPMDPDMLGKAFRRAATAAGVTGFHLHDLRHSFATEMIGAGVDVATVSEVLGHATVGFTLSVYVTPNAEMAERLAAAAEDRLGGVLAGS